MLLQIKRLALRPLPRVFGPLRKVELEHPGAGYLITCPPDPVALKVRDNHLSRFSSKLLASRLESRAGIAVL